jgi:hypothetical protein
VTWFLLFCAAEGGLWLGPDGPDDELTRALNQAAAAERYAFTVEERPPSAGSDSPLRAWYQKGRPLHATADGVELYKQGDAVVYRQGDRWLRSRRGTLSDPLPILGAVAKLNAVRPPHEEVAALAAEVKDVTKAEAAAGGTTVYRGRLTEAAVKGLVRPEFREVTRGGEVSFRVGAGGGLVQYTLGVRVHGRRGDTEIDGTVTKTVTLGEVGTARVEVPEAARKALE